MSLTIDEVVERATRRCGPCITGGDPVRDHLPAGLTPEARAALCARLDMGEAKYGAELKVGHENADIDLAEEIFDALNYAVSGRMTGSDLAMLVDAANRCAARTFGVNP